MTEQVIKNKKILITGGTSGLGLNLVRIFLEKGYHVVTTGRRELPSSEQGERFSYYRVDFSDLENTAAAFKEIIKVHEFDMVINNAGILSPVHRTITKNGLEYTFQVNFLAHFIINEIIIRNHPDSKKLRIATLSSPVYRFAKVHSISDNQYSAIGAYSGSKLYQAMMCSHLDEIYRGKNLLFFSFDPGVFSSGIYRMQSRFFSFLYKIAAPFMRSSGKVANVLASIITQEEIRSGVLYNYRKRIKPIPVPEKDAADAFWKECREKISSFLD
ncbi:MAG: SDR family NAD(P)-dependent oxidoreductase [Bacteroidales bacterium]|jgi:NAD(P)-dependent dehydrogenase (short-subunit alcohol dehydrogenase family)|nr:SDR family NAD(P)-dependent oxidoreductase [Bacteroidales bacterium]